MKQTKSLAILLWLIISHANVFANRLATGSTSLCFIENNGQISDQFFNPRNDIQFVLNTVDGINVYLSSGQIHYQFCKRKSEPSIAYPSRIDPKSKTGSMCDSSELTLYRIDLELIGANRNAQILKDQPQEYYETYYTANISTNGVCSRSYNKIIYQEIYPKIDWVLYVKDGKLKHEFVVHSGGKISDIRLKYGGANVRIDNGGNLIVTSPFGKITEAAPYAYQSDGKKISCNYFQNESTITYTSGQYSGDLIIDPFIQWATYYGGSNFEYTNSVTTDSLGNLYILGRTSSTSTIATTGSYQSTISGYYDVFLVKFNLAGARVWSTYFGGNYGEDCGAVTADKTGYIYFTGLTGSPSGIATASAYQTSLGGGSDAFLAKFDLNGIRQWATYYGGPNDDEPRAITTDLQGNVYIGGDTKSAYGIATPGAHQPAFSGGAGIPCDGFLAKFNSSGSRLWATYYGANTGEDYVNGLTCDTNGNIFMCGRTMCTSSIATPGSHQPIHGGGEDCFLVKFDSTGVRQWGTYYGGVGDDEACGIISDSIGNFYLTGYTNSPTGISTPGAFQTTMGGGAGDGFLSKFSNNGILLWGTYLGGEASDACYSASKSINGSICIVGSTTSTIGIASSGAYQPSNSGWGDGMFAIFNSGGSRLWSTYYGGEKGDWLLSIASDNMGRIYVAGATTSTTGISTTGSFRSTFSGDQDVFLVRFDTCSAHIAAITGPSFLCPEGTAILSDLTTGGIWSVSNSNATISSTGLISSISPGTVTISYTANVCSFAQVATKIMTMYALPSAGAISGSDSVCVGETTSLSNVSTGVWSSNNTNATIISSGVVTGVYAGRDTIMFVASNPCGSDTATFPITVLPKSHCETQISSSNHSNSEIQIYPNPSNGTFSMKFNSSINESAQVRISNCLGQKVRDFTILENKVETIIIPEPGIYIVTVHSQDYSNVDKVIIR